MSKVAVGGMLETTNLVLLKVLGVRSGPGVAGLTLSTLGAHGVNVICVVSSSDINDRENMTMAVNRDDMDQALGLVRSLIDDIEAERVEVVRNCCVISIYGPHFSERPAIAGAMFQALSAEGINIHAISTSVSTVSCIIDQDSLELARARLQESFLLP